MESGSSVKFSWVIDDLKEFAYEGGAYSVMFKKPAEYKLLVRKKRSALCSDISCFILFGKYNK